LSLAGSPAGYLARTAAPHLAVGKPRTAALDPAVGSADAAVDTHPACPEPARGVRVRQHDRGDPNEVRPSADPRRTAAATLSATQGEMAVAEAIATLTQQGYAPRIEKKE
jgi:hypothetical protein